MNKVSLSLALLVVIVHGGTRVEAASPGLEQIRRDLQDISQRSAPQLAADIKALAPPSTVLSGNLLSKLARDLIVALSGRTIKDPFLLSWLAGDLDQVINPDPGNEGQVSSAINDLGSALRKTGVADAQIQVVQADLFALVPRPATPRAPTGPAHDYRYHVARGPSFDRSVAVDDFEYEAPVWNKWYQPGWSKGIVATVQTSSWSTGKRGLTVSNQGPLTRYNGMATIRNPPLDITGMNAIRLWVKPYAPGAHNDKQDLAGSVTIGFIDGSDEIWQMEIPDFLSGSEPYVLQVRLADFKKMLRRNNGVIDPECRNFGFWMSGTYKFTVDDIRFVHDPSLPEFHASAAGPTWHARNQNLGER